MTMTLAPHVAGQCACGRTHSSTEAIRLNVPCDQSVADGVDQGLLHGLFPDAPTRRRLLATVGAAALIDAVSSFLPIDALRSMAATEKVEPEKKDIAIGFLAITCATPVIMAEHLGMFARQGLAPKLQKTPGIALLRDKLINGEYDLTQQVMPVPITVSMGIGSVADATRVLTIQNQHGNSLVLAMKHRDNRDPKNWKGFKFAVPFEQSHQAMLLRYYLAEHGLDPDQDVSYRVVPPTEYVSNLRTGNIDGFFGGEPGGQRAVYEGAGFIHLLSRDIWPGHPCCAFIARQAWIDKYPNTFLAAYRAIVEASLHVSQEKNRGGIAAVLAQQQYLNAPEVVVEQVISGRYADGLGNVLTAPDRVIFDPYPHYSMAIWLMTQLKRWGMIKGDVDYAAIARQVMLATEADKRFAELGLSAPSPFRTETIMGKAFDPARPDDYIASFPIRRT
jgi:nitrate/nitrite transport system substrate-binding protein